MVFKNPICSLPDTGGPGGRGEGSGSTVTWHCKENPGVSTWLVTRTAPCRGATWSTLRAPRAAEREPKGKACLTPAAGGPGVSGLSPTLAQLPGASAGTSEAQGQGRFQHEAPRMRTACSSIQLSACHPQVTAPSLTPHCHRPPYPPRLPLHHLTPGLCDGHTG